uniref:Uncharacterized protein n=1 Tax=Hyaloperonospora arabidopsidis (strain Emoy2) TaxID=559515 RepID=M4B9L4_HYAAE
MAEVVQPPRPIPAQSPSVGGGMGQCGTDASSKTAIRYWPPAVLVTPSLNTSPCLLSLPLSLSSSQRTGILPPQKKCTTSSSSS